MEKVVESLVGARNSIKSLWPSISGDKTSPKDLASQNSFTRAELESCSDGILFGAGAAQLPSAPLLMLDRIVDIQSTGGKYDRGYAIAELDITPSLWFFKHHFLGDPVMPGCFLTESLWQLTGFHLAWSGHKGRGRVLDGGRTRYLEPVDKSKKTLRISIHIQKLRQHFFKIALAANQKREYLL